MPSEVPQSSPTAYDSFAFAYNLYWGPASVNWLRWLSVLAIPRLKRGARVLDLCCGTGLLSAELSRRGLLMVGLDGSRAMLRYARGHAAEVPLLQADVRSFGMRTNFDAVLCVFDSLNHLLSPGDLAAAFCCVASCLRPGGLFVFDVNTALGYLLHWNGCHEMSGSGYRVRTWSHYDDQRRLGVFKASVVQESTEGRTADEVVLWQRCHSHAEITDALRLAGFGAIETYGLDRDSLVSGSLEHSERAFYLCRRSRSPRSG